MNDHIRDATLAWMDQKYGPPFGKWDREKREIALAAVQFLLDAQGQSINVDDTIEITTQVASATGEGLVLLRWGPMAARFTPDEARLHAVTILSGAAAAEMDALVMRLLREKIGVGMEQAAAVLADFRKMRDEKPAGPGREM